MNQNKTTKTQIKPWDHILQQQVDPKKWDSNTNHILKSNRHLHQDTKSNLCINYIPRGVWKAPKNDSLSLQYSLTKNPLLTYAEHLHELRS